MTSLLPLLPSAHPSWVHFPESLAVFPPHEAGGSLPCSILAWGRLAQERAGRASGFPGRHCPPPATSSLTPLIPSLACGAMSGPGSPTGPKGRQHYLREHQGWRSLRGFGSVFLASVPSLITSASLSFWPAQRQLAGLAGKRDRKWGSPAPHNLNAPIWPFSMQAPVAN